MTLTFLAYSGVLGLLMLLRLTNPNRDDESVEEKCRRSMKYWR